MAVAVDDHVPVEPEKRLIDVVRDMEDVFRAATGSTHPWLEVLADPSRWRDRTTLNSLASTASGSLGDRYFSASNRDVEPEDGFDSLNRRWRQLFDEAGRLANGLRLPAGRDYRPIW